MPEINTVTAILVFFILHVLVYPSSNGYNSYMDRDETPIGGLQHPMKPTRQLFYISILLDALAIGLSLIVSATFLLGIILYIIASRAYSYRRIRLKKYPVIGFLTVSIFQGALIFFITFQSCQTERTVPVPLLPCVISSLLIGALYPLTQVYQHEADRLDGVTTISMFLGKKGSFLFSASLFMLASALLAVFFSRQEALNNFYLYLLFMIPVLVFFLIWMRKVWQSGDAANFRSSFYMNFLATICTSLFFITLIIRNH